MRRTAECIDVKKGLRIAQTIFSIGNFVLPEDFRFSESLFSSRKGSGVQPENAVILTGAGGA